MPQTLPNGIIVPINPDAYNLTPDLATMGNSVKTYITALTKRTPGSASGTLTAGTWIDNGGTITVPAAPFGTGVQYTIQFIAQCSPTNGSGGGAAMRVLIDSSANIAAQSQIIANGTQTLACAGMWTISDNTSHTVEPQIQSLAVTATFTTGANISFLCVLLTPTVSF